MPAVGTEMRSGASDAPADQWAPRLASAGTAGPRVQSAYFQPLQRYYDFVKVIIPLLVGGVPCLRRCSPLRLSWPVDTRKV